jgi:phosphate transport system substrate-binding protein
MTNACIKALAAFAWASVFSTALAQEVTGAGATFPAPLYAKWADAYNKATGVRINYQSVGSGAGLRQIRGKTVAFGASDMPLTDDELQKDGLVQFPTVIGGGSRSISRDRGAPTALTGKAAHLYWQNHQANDPAITALKTTCYLTLR